MTNDDIFLNGPASLQSIITIRVYVRGDTSVQYDFIILWFWNSTSGQTPSW